VLWDACFLFIIDYDVWSPALQVPVEFDIDSENSEDCYMCPEYAKDIFDYLKRREVCVFFLNVKSSSLSTSSPPLSPPAGEVHPPELHAGSEQPEPGDEGHPDRLAGGGAGESPWWPRRELARHTRVDHTPISFQENFELYHETLYLAVKMADHYLAKTPVHRELLQLVGSTAMLIASKFEVKTHQIF